MHFYFFGIAPFSGVWKVPKPDFLHGHCAAIGVYWSLSPFLLCYFTFYGHDNTPK